MKNYEILDPPEQPTHHTSNHQTKWILLAEVLTVFIFLAGIIIRDLLGFGLINEPIVLSGFVLTLLYLFGYWWLNKALTVNFITIMLSILYGLTLTSFIFSLQFLILYFTGGIEMSIIGFGLLGFTIFVDIISAARSKRVIDQLTVIRLSIMAISALILCSLSEDRRIHYTFRNYPDFLNYYEKHRRESKLEDIRHHISKDEHEGI